MYNKFKFMQYHFRYVSYTCICRYDVITDYLCTAVLIFYRRQIHPCIRFIFHIYWCTFMNSVSLLWILTFGTIQSKLLFSYRHVFACLHTYIRYYEEHILHYNIISTLIRWLKMKLRKAKSEEFSFLFW